METNFREFCTHRLNSSSCSYPLGPTMTHAFITRPVMSNGFVCGSASADAAFFFPQSHYQVPFERPAADVAVQEEPVTSEHDLFRDAPAAGDHSANSFGQCFVVCHSGFFLAGTGCL